MGDAFHAAPSAVGFIRAVGGGCPLQFQDWLFTGPSAAMLSIPWVNGAANNPGANTRSLFADRLVEAGSVGDGSAGGRVPEPVETCGFCFPGHGSAVQETKSCHGTSYHIGERAAPSHSGICSTGSAGAISSPEDGHFKIICSPAQEKMPMV